MIFTTALLQTLFDKQKKKVPKFARWQWQRWIWSKETDSKLALVSTSSVAKLPVEVLDQYPAYSCQYGHWCGNCVTRSRQCQASRQSAGLHGRPPESELSEEYWTVYGCSFVRPSVRLSWRTGPILCPVSS